MQFWAKAHFQTGYKSVSLYIHICLLFCHFQCSFITNNPKVLCDLIDSHWKYNCKQLHSGIRLFVDFLIIFNRLWTLNASSWLYHLPSQEWHSWNITFPPPWKQPFSVTTNWHGYRKLASNLFLYVITVFTANFLWRVFHFGKHLKDIFLLLYQTWLSYRFVVWKSSWWFGLERERHEKCWHTREVPKCLL